MDRRMVGKHHPLAAGSLHPGSRGPVRVHRPAGRGWRPDVALCVSVIGLAVGLVVLIRLVAAVAPGPPSVFGSTPDQSRAGSTDTQALRPPGANATYRSGAGVVTRGVAYVPLSVTRVTRLSVPGSATGVHGNLLVVKLLVRGVSARRTTASVGLVDLVAGGVDYRPLLPVVAALAHTRWQTLVLKTLTAGASKRVKLIFAVAPGTPTGLKLLVGSHTAGAARFAIPVGPAA